MADLRELIISQQRAGFPDLAGARVAAFVPVSDHLLNEIIARELPAGAPVSEVSLTALPDNRIAVRAKLARAPMLPAVKVTFTIVQQPLLPDDPVLVLRMGSSGLMSVAGSALNFFDVLPPGITAQGDRVMVDVRELLARRGLEWLPRHIADLQVTTEAGVVLVSVTAKI